MSEFIGGVGGITDLLLNGRKSVASDFYRPVQR